MIQRLLVAGILLACALLILSGPASSPTTVKSLASQAEIRYALMLDAGSTGSRIHVYKFIQDAKGRIDVVSEVFVQVKPGLSSFATDPAGAARSLDPLMDAALEAVPKNLHKCTPVALYATAGLRLLPTAQVDAILASVTSYLTASPFKVGPNAVQILDGKDEGVFAWVTVNFLLGNFQPGMETVGIMDLGGGSTQIVLAPEDDDEIDALPDQYVASVPLGETAMDVYQYSHLGYGLMEARKAHRTQAAAQSDCVRDNHEVDGMASSPGAGFDTCLAAVKGLLKLEEQCATDVCSINGHPQPASDSFPDMYAFSFFYDRAMDTPSLSKDIVTVGEYGVAARQYCDEDKHVSPYQCFDLTFMYALLRHGYKLSDDTSLSLTKKIRDFETGWCLGAAMTLVQQSPRCSER